MKIFAAGIATETNTFAPVPTAQGDFLVQRGADVRAGRIEYPSLNLAALWGPQAKAGDHELLFGLMAWAHPGGTTIKRVYESLRDELLSELRAVLPVDIVLLNLHGAMIAQGYDDCERDIIQRVRDLAGKEAVIGVELDLHCHLSEPKIAPADIVITYKEYPHVDTTERARELFEIALKTATGEIHPKMALFDCRMIGFYPTTRQPLRQFIEEMVVAERRSGVLSVSFGHGFQFADGPHVGAKVLVVTDDDLPLAEEVASEFGLKIYAQRHKVGVETFALPLEEALSRALAGREFPVVVADSSDNPGGGAPGDSTYALSWLLEHDASNAAIAIIYDPEVVKIAKAAGVGASLSVRLGGKMGRASGDPVDLEVSVLALRESYIHAFPQERGEPWLFPAGDVAALTCGGIDLVVSSLRCQCFSPSIFSDLGIEPEKKRLLVVKSVQHFYAAFAPMAGEVIYMVAPGAVTPDPRQINYLRLNTARLYPWNDDPLCDTR